MAGAADLTRAKESNMDKATKTIREAAKAGVTSWSKTYAAVQMAVTGDLKIASVEFNRKDKAAVLAEVKKITDWAYAACKGIADGFDGIKKYVNQSASIVLVPECATTVETGSGDKKAIRNLDGGSLKVRRDLQALSVVANEYLGLGKDNTASAAAKKANAQKAKAKAADPVAIAKEHEKAKAIEKKAVAIGKSNLLEFKSVVAMALDGKHSDFEKALNDVLAAKGLRIVNAEILKEEVKAIDRKAQRAAATAARVAKAKAEAKAEQAAAAAAK